MYSFQPQQPLLRPYVKQIHHFSIRPTALSSMTIIPTGNVFLSLFWGSGAFVTQRPNSTERAVSGGIFISGQQFEIAHLCVNNGEINTIGFELTPDAIHQFFGVPQQETTGQVLKLEDLWCQEAQQLYQQVIDQPDLARQLAIVEHFLCQRILSRQWKENQVVDEAIALINQTHGNIAIPNLANALRISPRSLERRFLQAVGISPKAYSKVIQFNHAFRQLALYKKHVLDVVAETGYYDQSHFVHHFRKVFGMSPGQFFDEQENFLYFFKEDTSQYRMDSLANALTDMHKLYVF